MTAIELLAVARRDKPHVRYAMNRQGTCIGAWNDKLRRFQVVAETVACGCSDAGKWVVLPFEVLLNGEPTVAASDWIE